MIELKIGLDGVPDPRKILLGNKYENNDEIIHFDIPQKFDSYFKYIIAVINYHRRTITRVIPIKDNICYVSSDLTCIAGTWSMYLMCRESELNLNSYDVNMTPRLGEHVFISDGFLGLVRDNELRKDIIDNIPMDTNLQILYNDLFLLKKQLEEIIESGGTLGSVSWENIKNKPSEFPPSSHEHDDLYYTKEQINNEVSDEIIKKVIDGVLPQVQDGKSAYEIAVENGFKGTEQEWLSSLKGEDGKSAYQIAVENGFEGTEEEWLDSLHGSGSSEPIITQYDDLMEFPVIGNENHIYIDKSTNSMYRWDVNDLKYYTSPNILNVDVIDGGSSVTL